MKPLGSLLDDGFEWSPRTGTHRYCLEQTFGRSRPSERPLVVVALNPGANTPEGYRRSDTCRKAKLWAAPRGFDGVIYLNLFTAIEVQSTALHRADLVVDDAADGWFLTAAARSTGPIVAAWGARPGKVLRAVHAERVAHVLKLLQPHPLVCLGLTASGAPLHPRAWKQSAEPQPYKAQADSESRAERAAQRRSEWARASSVMAGGVEGIPARSSNKPAIRVAGTCSNSTTPPR